MRGPVWLIAVLAAASACQQTDGARGRSSESAVRVEADGGTARLLRGGAAYKVKGAGGDGSRELLARIGGNSIRTWGADKLGETLDAAQRLGLTVTAGIWLGHERHGFRYSDPAQVAKQKEDALRTVAAHRGHPALLIWSLGNEMEGDGSRPEIWQAINDLARDAKRLDPNHPTMTVISEVGGDKIRNLHRYCPDIDIVGINSYAGAATLAERYVAAGGAKPFIVTEFGPPGTWEVAKTAWGAPIEPTSAEKAAWYRNAWEKTVAASRLCLGGYAFLWGNKQETTATWFGMLLPDGAKLAPADTMADLWTGKPPPNRCPTISSLRLEGPAEVAPGALVRATMVASDPDRDILDVRWALQAEATRTGAGGEAETAPTTFPEAVRRSTPGGAEVRMPEAPRAYRLFVYVRDGQGGAATANIPLLAKGPQPVRPARKATFPFVIYDEHGNDHPPYAPSGWMGATEAIKLDEKWAQKPAVGKTCLRCDYKAPGAWGGVAWQDPAGDWGDRPGGWDLQGASRLTWRARGASGGETVTFLFGLIGPEKPYPDTAQRKLENVRLTTEWTRHSMPLAGLDLSRIKTGFGWTLAGQGKPVTFFLDDIRIE